jgi:tetratricopeptide (TPR) repeat protein
VAITTAPVMFTDLVGSTELRARLGEDAAEQLRRLHDQRLGEAIATHDGVVVKGLGDGLMATFPSAADAVAAAVEVQQAVDDLARRQPEQAFGVRIGISVGDVTVEDNDLFGIPVVEASRLCAAANAGEILVADVVRTLARGRHGTLFEPIGDLDLKGLPDAVPACRVAWEPAIGGSGAVPLPALLVGGAATAYVGREAVVADLLERSARIRRGGCAAVLLAGEPGAGKTRTAAEIARVAHGEGAVVLYGRCEEDLGVPYQPFVEALEWQVRHDPATPLGRLPGELVRLLPDLDRVVPDLPRPAPSDARTEEYRLFEAVASWLAAASSARGLVLVVDDLHWAAKPTLSLLLHVLRSIEGEDDRARLLVIGTYRDTDIDRAHPLFGVVGDLRRLPSVQRVPIGGLTCDEVEAFIEAAAGAPLGEAGRRLASMVHAETEGNPFFVGEVLRHLVESGAVRREESGWVVPHPDEVAVPEGVRDVVGRRLSRLSDEANGVLSTAAVLGREIDLDVLSLLCEVDETGLLDVLDEAVRARLVEETGADRYRFAHALVRTTLYDELSATRRRRLHRRVAEVLEKIRPDDVVALAHHCTEGGPEGGSLTRAIRYTIAAADQALAGRAPAEAEARYLQALEMLQDTDEADPHDALDALTGLGESQRDLGNQAFRRTLTEAGQRAEALGDTSRLVRAVLGNFRGITNFVGAVDDELVALTESALRSIGQEPSADRARLLAHLAAELTFAGDRSRRLALATEADDIASALGDDHLLVWVRCRNGYAAVDPASNDEYLRRYEDAIRLAEGTGDPMLRMISRVWYSTALATNGEIVRAIAERQRWREEAEVVSPTTRWMARATDPLALSVLGQLDEAEQAANDALALGEQTDEPDRENWWAATLAGIAAQRGTVGALADLAGEFADTTPNAPTWRSTHLWLLAEAGRLDEATAVWSQLDLGRLADEPFPHVAPTCIAFSSRLLDHRGMAVWAQRHLLPFAGQWAHFFIHALGPVSWGIAASAETLGRYDDAVDGYDRALADTVAIGALPITARIELDLAETLLKRHQPGDAARAAALVTDARAVAEQIGATGVVARADRLSLSGPG